MGTNNNSAPLYYIYFIREQNSPYVKIGYSNDPKKRVAELQTGNPHTLELVHAVQVSDEMTAKKIEQAFQRRFARVTVRGEWFVLSGSDWEDIKLILTVARESSKAERRRYQHIIARIYNEWINTGTLSNFSFDDKEPAWMTVDINTQAA